MSACVAKGEFSNFTVCFTIVKVPLSGWIVSTLNRRDLSCCRTLAVPQSALHVVAGVDDGQIQREEGLLRRQNPNILPGEGKGGRRDDNNESIVGTLTRPLCR